MEIEFLKRVAKEAEKISQRNYEVRPKDDKGDLVTNLDLEIEKYLISEIEQNYPDFTIVSEEFNSDKTTTDNCFIIDPIDGTINFANGLPIWGTQIACRKNGKMIASVINLPMLHEFYHADETGAYLNNHKISVRQVPIKNALYSVFGAHSDEAYTKVREHSRNFRSLGATCATAAFTASGRMHGFSFRVEQPWDYIPGLFLCEMAGAKVKNVKGFHAVAMNQEFLDILEKETALYNN